MDELDALPTEKRPRRITWLFVGLLFGVLGTVFVPSLVRPYLPAALRGTTEQIDGSVFKKQLEEGENARLLLSVDTEHGAVLATFTRKVSEIDMLVDEGDRVTLDVAGYAPFISDPIVAGVQKGPAGDGSAAQSRAQDEASGEAAGADERPAEASAEASSEDAISPSSGGAEGETEADGDTGEAGDSTAASESSPTGS